MCALVGWLVAAGGYFGTHQQRPASLLPEKKAEFGTIQKKQGRQICREPLTHKGWRLSAMLSQRISATEKRYQSAENQRPHYQSAANQRPPLREIRAVTPAGKTHAKSPWGHLALRGTEVRERRVNEHTSEYSET